MASKRIVWLLVLAGASSVGVVGHAELPQWLQHVEAGRIEQVFFRSVPFPSGSILIRRPPQETRPALTELIAAAPADARLMALRGREGEQQLDFAAAEADWREHARLASDSGAGLLELADFYHRRVRPLDEIQTLARAAQAPAPASDRWLPVAQRRSWRAFERIMSVVRAHALPPSETVKHYQAWMARFPRERAVYHRYFDFLIKEERYRAAEQLVASYQKAFPTDDVFPIRARAETARRRNGQTAALAVYEGAFRPLLPPDLIQSYFTLLRDTRSLRGFIDRARADIAANPDDLNSTARVFYYYQQQGNLAAAERALVEYRIKKESRSAAWSATELFALGRLSEGAQDHTEAARYYYALYSLPSAADHDVEKGLVGLTNLLLSVPEMPVPLGMDDLSMYRDIATQDAYPGFLNGILSLILNSTDPAERYGTQNTAATAYFHRVRAGELLTLLGTRFPNSRDRPALLVKLLESYATYGDGEAVIRRGSEFLATFPRATERTRVALLMASAYARLNRVEEEFATYDSLLKELAARAEGVPLGAGANVAQAFRPANVAQGFRPAVPGDEPPAPDGTTQNEPDEDTRGRSSVAARSPEYARVLDRYISRLVTLKRIPAALALYRRELDRNPNDPGLYERLAAFLDQNRRGDELERLYRLAIQRFPDRSWHHKLARWHLRRQRAAAFEQLTREIITTFSGSELEAYFRDIVGQNQIEPVLYRQINLYAQSRFPHDLVFVRNLLLAYERRETRDTAAWESLLRSHWLYDEELRVRFLASLKSGNRLRTELDAARALVAHPRSNPAVARFVAEAEIWQSHFEAAAPVLQALASAFPGTVTVSRRASAVHRSLAAYDGRLVGAAVQLEEQLQQLDPRDRLAITRAGEIYADRSEFARARPYWNRLAGLEPGQAHGYLDAATVFWDYFLYDDALRVIEEGRKKLAAPALHAYEAGAIYENKRQFRRALEEYVRGAFAAESSASRDRLLVLAERPAYREAIDELTRRAVFRAGSEPDLPALGLREAVLQAQNRRTDLEKLLTEALQSSRSPETIEAIQQSAERLGFRAIERRAAEQHLAVTTDPVEQTRLRLALAKLLESHGDTQAAQAAIDQVYAQHSTVLGVVRATVDFYWRHKMVDRALDRLVEAANRSYPALKNQFLYEAARKATDVARYDRAREMLRGLLQQTPFDGEYVAAMADTYAREGNDKALREFYTSKIEELRAAPLSADERHARVALLRRGLIPALARLNDFSGVVDQYIELINRYPEDADLVRETARFAQRHGRDKQLVDYYTKTITEAPRDARWPMVLGRLETQLERYPAAIADYARAIEIRPDRLDLHEARASLQERLLAFEDAARSYTRLYELSYRNPTWMAKVAEIRARQPNETAAVQALRQALIEGRPERADLFFEAARRLERWELLQPAREFAERAVQLAGSELLTDYRYAIDAGLYARIMTRLRRHEAAYAVLHASAQQAGPEVVQSALQPVWQQMGQSIAQFFTPEEKASVSTFLARERTAHADRLESTLLPLVQHAKLGDLEARWRHELMLTLPTEPGTSIHHQRLIELQRARMKFDELGGQLESYWQVYPNVPDKNHILDQAAASYRDGGNEDAELRVLTRRYARAGSLEGDARYFELLLKKDPERLVTLAGQGSNSATSYAVAYGDSMLARRAVVARGQRQPPVWTRAYLALAGTYHTDAAPEVNTAFIEALGTATIGDRLGKPVDRKQQLAGTIWFYYGSRYGEYLASRKQPSAEDYLPAILEESPARASAYFTLAEFYRDRGDVDQARREYEHVLELNPRRAEAHDRLAVMLWQAGVKQEAIKRWQTALTTFAQTQTPHQPQQEWLEGLRMTLQHISRRDLLMPLAEPLDAVLRGYVRRHGAYRLEFLLADAFAATDRSLKAGWLLDLAAVAPDRATFLGELANAEWLSSAHREAAYKEVLATLTRDATQAQGEAQRHARARLRRWQVQWVDYLIQTRQSQLARTAFEALDRDERQEDARHLTRLEIQLSAQLGTLDALLARYRRDLVARPPLEDIRHGAANLRAAGDAEAARNVLEFVYLEELDRGNLTSANFLGLAEVYLERGELARALTILRRMTLIVDDGFESLALAANLLDRFQRVGDALELRASRVRAVPWDYVTRVALAQALVTSGKSVPEGRKTLLSVARDDHVSYALRVAAARGLASAPERAQNLGSTELDLLASTASPSALEQPFFFHARIDAAQRATDPHIRTRLLVDAIAIDPAADAARLELCRAARTLERHQLAISGVAPLIRGAEHTWRVSSRDSRSTRELEEPEAESGDDQFLSSTGLSRSARADVAAALADSHEKVGDLETAEGLWQLALRLDGLQQAQAERRDRLQRVRAAQSLRAENADRQPVVTDAVDQPRLVRPRLNVAQAFRPAMERP